MNVIGQIESGYFRGDRAAAKYLGMDRKTFAKLVRGEDGPKPIIKGGFRYWKKAALDDWMQPVEGSAYTVRPDLAARNRERAAAAQQVSTTTNITPKNE